MSKEFYFISGLPRSGSTLLSAILRQNPNFYADITSPLNLLVINAIDILTNSDSNQYIDETKRQQILSFYFNGFYNHIKNPTVFDTSRRWTASTSLLKTLFPNTKILCCVREIKWILDSFERIAAKNCMYTNSLIEDEARDCVETRCKSLMDPTKNGTIIKPWHWLQEGLALNPEMIYIVEYENLCRDPKKIISSIYKFLDKPFFNHDFNNVDYQNKIVDNSINLKDLHTVRKKVEYIEKKCVIPDYVIKKYYNMDFWKQNNFNYL